MKILRTAKTIHLDTVPSNLVLIVNDLKNVPARGGIALWIGPGTVAHFSNLKLTTQ